MLRSALVKIASDFSFTWIAEARPLFADLEPRRFAELHHNPLALLSELTDEDLARALTPEYLERLARVEGRLVRDHGEETWWRERGRGPVVASATLNGTTKQAPGRRQQPPPGMAQGVMAP